ncbi:uncharacterized protein N7529_010137 [Penicillium soppii]|jgi:hypothetical protein|uniref:uncharacterized protein n=1 Tax=Penicillium soppii TaxID=69789 RepID=UPI002546D2CD|nr:uncharacterized protein N7529_010137 [Penicillium soppii]KAJ5856193.1 hypothetical protein N7529_010137 [Penicillium soppii]
MTDSQFGRENPAGFSACRPVRSALGSSLTQHEIVGKRRSKPPGATTQEADAWQDVELATHIPGDGL